MIKYPGLPAVAGTILFLLACFLPHPRVIAGPLEEQLVEAASMGKIEKARQLIEAGADVDAKDQFGFTPLSIFRKNNHAAIAAYLKAKGAEL